MHKDDHNPLNRSPYCGDAAALVSYLYNDGSADELSAIATHVQGCTRCTSELAALGDTRDVLSAWSPPPTELGFTLSSSEALPVPAALTQPDASVSSLPWWRQSTPVWMQALAATVVFGAGLAVGTSGGNAPSAAPAVTAGTAAAVSRSELSDLETRLRAELARLSAAAAAPAPAQTSAPANGEALLRQVRTLLTDSEERQRRELALRTTQVLRDIEIQRKVDIATLQQDIGQISGATGEQIRQNRQLYDMLMKNASLPGRGQ